MQIIISPAKKMVEDRDSLAPRSVPQFLPQTRQLLKVLRAMSPQELQRLWSCNDAIARLNIQRLETMELEGAAGSVMGRYYRKTFACNDG